MLEEGEKAPEFRLKDQDGREKTLQDLLEERDFLILYFYPRDDTPGCTKEACGFRDNISELRSLGAEVVGVSIDSPESHIRFIKKYSLPFTLLSDEDGQVARRFGAYSEEKGRCLRKTFIIGKDGRIIKVFNKVKPEEHAGEIIDFLKSLR